MTELNDMIDPALKRLVAFRVVFPFIMTFKIGHVDGKEEESTPLEVYLDGELSHEYELAWDGPIQTITVPLNYAANVKLYLPTFDSYFGLFDISFSE